MPRREIDENGEFVQNNSVEREEDGFLREWQGYAALMYRFWKVLPLILIILIVAKYFQVSQKLVDILVEILCGTGCKCSTSCSTGKSSL
jgi:hypothetical protein